MPSPSNPTREVRRDFTPLENENAPRGAFELLAERVGFEPTVDSRLRLISSQVHSTTLPPLRVENGYFRKIAIVSELACTAKLTLARHLPTERFYPAHIRPQHLGDDHTAIGLLVVLQNGDQRSTDGKTRAIQCV